MKSEVVRDGSLVTLSLLDEQLAMKVKQAFELHNWVARVHYVSKKPSGHVMVELDYRRPVAWVEVVNQNGRGLLPIDRDGVVLPTDDFSEIEDPSEGYARIMVSGFGMPAGLVGTVWGDKRVEGAARIADAFGDAWKETGLYKIVCPESKDGRAECEFELHESGSKGKGRVFWGSAPGHEKPGEAPVRIKVAHLLDYIRDGGSLNDADVNIRSGAVIVAPRTASKPEPFPALR